MARFLLVGMEPSTYATSLARVLEVWRQRVFIAYDADEARAKLDRAEYDAIIADFGMPTPRDGRNFLREVSPRVGGRIPMAVYCPTTWQQDVFKALSGRVRSETPWVFPTPIDVRVLADVVRDMLVVRRAYAAPESLTIQRIRRQPNPDVRRILRHVYGEERYLTDVGATLADMDSVPIDLLAPGAGTITRALLADDEGRRFLVATDGSTRKVYYMEVPGTVSTCQAAYDALSGRPGFRTIMEA